MNRARSFVGALVFLAPGVATAQDLWPDPRRDLTLDLEWVRPRIDGADFGAVAGLWRLSAGIPLDPKARLVVVVPYTVTGLDVSFGEDQSALGNVYVGGEIGAPGATLAGHLGVYLPTAPGDAVDPALVGLLTDFDRFEAYLPDVIAVRGGLHYRQADPGGVRYGFRVGASGIAPTGGGGGSELLVDYGFLFGIEQDRVRILGTLDGRLFATAGGGLGFAERTVHQAGVELTLLGGRVEPRLILRVPMDELLEDAGPMVGLGATVRVGR
ncbi:MAG TPA: hypothetical protein VJ773_00515 [Gemmatimonadales bacterium]|nr:hypothetical protein [Gemmatimonadales bacterium]